jgi:hypothetical protein
MLEDSDAGDLSGAPYTVDDCAMIKREELGTDCTGYPDFSQETCLRLFATIDSMRTEIRCLRDAWLGYDQPQWKELNAGIRAEADRIHLEREGKGSLK